MDRANITKSSPRSVYNNNQKRVDTARQLSLNCLKENQNILKGVSFTHTRLHSNAHTHMQTIQWRPYFNSVVRRCGHKGGTTHTERNCCMQDWFDWFILSAYVSSHTNANVFYWTSFCKAFDYLCAFNVRRICEVVFQVYIQVCECICWIYYIAHITGLNVFIKYLWSVCDVCCGM